MLNIAEVVHSNSCHFPPTAAPSSAFPRPIRVRVSPLARPFIVQIRSFLTHVDQERPNSHNRGSHLSSSVRSGETFQLIFAALESVFRQFCFSIWCFKP